MNLFEIWAKAFVIVAGLLTAAGLAGMFYYTIPLAETWEAAKRRVLRDRSELWKELVDL